MRLGRLSFLPQDVVESADREICVVVVAVVVVVVVDFDGLVAFVLVVVGNCDAVFGRGNGG